MMALMLPLVLLFELGIFLAAWNPSPPQPDAGV